MTVPIQEELRHQFDLVSLRREARALRTSEQWGEVQNITKRSNRAQAQEEALYTQRYDTRVEQARKRLIDEAGAKPRHLKPGWASDDHFSPDATLRQARRDVEAAHKRRVQRIVDWERGALHGLIEQSMPENSIRGAIREDFDRVVEPRSGTERRKGRNYMRDR
jgi:hypothetical protein